VSRKRKEKHPGCGCVNCQKRVPTTFVEGIRVQEDYCPICLEIMEERVKAARARPRGRVRGHRLGEAEEHPYIKDSHKVHFPLRRRS